MPSKRACDCCRVRKIKCNGERPCKACARISLQCTYLKVPQKTGPKRPKNTTLNNIKALQGQLDPQWQGGLGSVASRADVATTPFPGELSLVPTTPAFEYSYQRVPLSSLRPYLELFREKLQPIWLLVTIHDLDRWIAADTVDQETYVLLTALSAATITRLQLGDGRDGGRMAARQMALECQRARHSFNYLGLANEYSIAVSFFLHIYFANADRGGATGPMYLREAISFAHMMNLHVESTYAAYPEPVADHLRTVYFLLLVTERGHCLHHVHLRIPLMLDPTIPLPDAQRVSTPLVGPGFVGLLALFLFLDREICYHLRRDPRLSIPRDALLTIHRRLQAHPLPSRLVTKVQQVDIVVTLFWMQILFWQIALADQLSLSLTLPIEVTQRLLTVRDSYGFDPHTFELHGTTMERKLTLIGDALADVIICSPFAHNSTQQVCHWKELLRGLARIVFDMREFDSDLRLKFRHKLSLALGATQMTKRLSFTQELNSDTPSSSTDHEDPDPDAVDEDFELGGLVGPTTTTF
ncbi:uncharacterized protein V1510DRAFT_366591 [Dipodascopsis tothii]|uniref:uncharacterized protein n=1 Tax=Dipodascopsis tothii TaxID=44089 RepID=UPI0034CF1118